MRTVLLRVAAFLLPLTFAACADLPTATPLPDASSAGPQLSGECTKQADGTYKCPPISSDPGCIFTCDDGGGDDPCMESTGGEDAESATFQSCPQPSPGDGSSGGTPPPGGSGGDGSSGSTRPSLTPSTTTDLVEEDSLPDCSNSASWTADWHGPYCNGSPPTGTLLDAYNAELDAMEQKGDFCAELAQFGRTLLAEGRVRYYTGSGSTLRSWGGPVVGIIMDDGFVTNPAPYDHGFALAHELEHAYTGYQHTASDVDANGVHHTPNDTACG